MKQRSWNLWSGLHLVLALAVPLLLLALLSCKRAKEERADLGPEVSGKQIDEALHKALKDVTLDSLRIGQYLNYVVLRRIENSDTTMTLGTTDVAVVDSTEEASQIKYTLQINKSFRNDDGSFRTITSEDRLYVAKPAGGESVTSAATLARSASLWLGQARAALRAAEAAPSGTPKRVSFHNLREADDNLQPPAKVRARPDCGGLAGCTLPVHFVRFDMAIWANDTDYQKVSLDFGFSTATPFLPFGRDFDALTGLLVIDCRSTYVPVESRNVYVRDCQQVEDFKR